LAFFSKEPAGLQWYQHWTFIISVLLSPLDIRLKPHHKY